MEEVVPSGLGRRIDAVGGKVSSVEWKGADRPGPREVSSPCARAIPAPSVGVLGGCFLLTGLVGDAPSCGGGSLA